MKQTVMLCILLALVTVLFCCGREEQASPPPVMAPEEGVGPGPDAEIGQLILNKVKQVDGDLRALATAVESYFVDYNAYPPNLNVLTTPIAYIPKVMKDPFKPDADLGYKKLGDKDWILWSVGPDGKDDGGEVIYDKSKGVESAGDIVRQKQ